jgi:hypothetical protein
LKFPPFIVRAADSLKRLRAFVDELSIVRVPPEFIVIAEYGIAPEPLKMISPLLIEVAPVKLLKD